MAGIQRLEDDCLFFLVIGHAAAQRRLFDTAIAQSGGKAIFAAEGSHGLAAAKALQPGIIIVDGHALEGGFIDDLRKACGGCPSFVIATIALRDQKRFAPFLDAGVDDLIPVPLHKEMVITRLALAQRVFRQSRANRSLVTQLHHYSETVASLHFRLRDLAERDTLTALPNRQQAMLHLEKAWSTANAAGRPLSCLVVLLSGLRQVNQRYGHERGDVTLKTVAALLKSRLRAEDALYRIDGNEFLVICPDTALDAAMALGGRLHRVLRETFGSHPSGVPLKLHMGVAEHGLDVTSAQVLVDLASAGAHRARQLDGGSPCAVQLDGPRPARFPNTRSRRRSPRPARLPEENLFRATPLAAA